jgi:hypothetical protein
VLAECDLGQQIRSITSYDGKRRYAFFDGSIVRFVLPPRRELRFRSVDYGQRDPALPCDVDLSDGLLLEVWVPVDSPNKTILRVNMTAKVTVGISLALEHGREVAARCVTTAKPAEVRTEARGERIYATATFELHANLENDLEFVQT